MSSLRLGVGEGLLVRLRLLEGIQCGIHIREDCRHEKLLSRFEICHP